MGAPRPCRADVYVARLWGSCGTPDSRLANPVACAGGHGSDPPYARPASGSFEIEVRDLRAALPVRGAGRR